MADRAGSRTSERGSPPVATYLLIVAQVVAWIVVRRYLLAGGDWTDFALRPGTPSELSLLISPFIHLEPAHLGVNLTVLWLIGTNLERAVGTLRFVGLYLGSAWFASLMQWAVFTSFHLFPDLGGKDAAVGSSGAIAGVLGAGLVRFPGARLRLPLLSRVTFAGNPIVVLWLTYTLVRALVTTVSGVTEGVGHWAHLAGFVFGLGAAQMLGLQMSARAEFLHRAAEQAAEKQDLPTAARTLAALLAMRPQDTHVRGTLVAVRLALGDREGALHLAREGLVSLIRADARASAIESFREYSTSLPELTLPPGIRYRLGCWLAEAGDAHLAHAALLASVSEDAGTPGAVAALFRAGQVARDRLGNHAMARAAWEQLLSEFPDSSWADQARGGLRGLPNG